MGYKTSRHGRVIESYREGDILVLRVHGLYARLEDPDYNKDPIQDRYDWESKAVIYSTVNLPDHLKHYFGVSEVQPSN